MYEMCYTLVLMCHGFKASQIRRPLSWPISGRVPSTRRGCRWRLSRVRVAALWASWEVLLFLFNSTDKRCETLKFSSGRGRNGSTGRPDPVRGGVLAAVSDFHRRNPGLGSIWCCVRRWVFDLSYFSRDNNLYEACVHKPTYKFHASLIYGLLCFYTWLHGCAFTVYIGPAGYVNASRAS